MFCLFIDVTYTYKHTYKQTKHRVPGLPMLLHVKNCVLYIDISVEFAFDSCVEISKFP